MDYWWVAIPIVLALVLIVALVLRKSREAEPPVTAVPEAEAALIPRSSEMLAANEVREEFLVSIPVEPLETVVDESRLALILDRTVIARINQTVPAMAEIATRTAVNNSLGNMQVYKAILPSGQTLAKSKAMEGAYRGFVRGGRDYTSEIRNHANFVKVDPSEVTALASGVANVMNVASLVVGQYYMSEINGRLETLTGKVDAVADFQQREFKSRILSLIAHVGEISRFSAEIMEDSTQRHIKLQTLDHLRLVATDLLGQVILTMDGITADDPSPDYKAYERRIGELAMLARYQHALIVVLEDIGELTYLLGKGSVSRESSQTLLKSYLQQCERARTQLMAWHDSQVARLQIDLSKERRAKSGWDAFFAAVPSVIDDKWKYRALEQGVVAEIGIQASPAPMHRSDLEEVYDQDVEIVVKDGKYYYVH